MSGIAAGGRGFGVTNRRNRTTARQQPSGQKWVQVSQSTAKTAPVELLGGPVPVEREKVERTFNTYCRLSLGHPRKAAAQKVDLLRQLFGFIKEVDGKAAIQPYLPTDNVNSVCHPAHILDKPTDFEHYFPEVKYFHRRIRTQCRLSTSIPIKDIKYKIFDKLRVNDFWIEPTLITSHESSRCGFFLYAHPDFTFRNDIMNVLNPILNSKIDQNIKLEFDVQPEKLNVNLNNTKLGERVVMLRSTPTHSEQVQQILTQLFTVDDATDIQTLRKYIFVPLRIAGDEDRSTLQGVLRTQQMFRLNVQHYIVTNIWNITKQYQVETIQQGNPDEEMENVTAEEETQEEAAANDDDNHQIDSEKPSNDNGNQTSLSDAAALGPATEPYSLREWFYDLTDTDNEPLLHAVYPSSDANKIFVLCEKQKAVKVLRLLHNLVDVASIDFPDEALLEYFGANKQNPFVHNHPKATAQTTAYGSHLTTFVTAGNPQENLQQHNAHVDPPRNAKRTRDGAPRDEGKHSSYAAAAGGSSIHQANTANYGTDVNTLLNRLNANLQTLESVSQKQQQQDTALAGFENRFQQVENGLRGHGAILESLARTQECQGKLMTSLNTKMDDLTQIITGTRPEDTLTQNLQAVTQQSQQTLASNPSQGAPEGNQP